MSGMFIVVEGIDGAGKSTLCQNLRSFFESEGLPVVCTEEPTHDEIGMFIRRGEAGPVSPTAESLLFAADRAVHTEKIREWTSSGKIVICDRYYASTLAYQAVPLGGPAPDRDWLEAVNGPIVTEPDITFLLDADPQESMLRVGRRGGRSKFEDEEYLGKVRENYLRIAHERGFIVLDGNSPPSEVTSEAKRAIERKKVV